MNPKYQAIEIAKPTENPEDVLLGGIYELADINDIYKKDIDSNDLTDKNTFESFIGCDENIKFHYTLCSYDNTDIKRYESGIGYCFKKDNNVYLKRFKPTSCGRNFSHNISCSNKHSYSFVGKTVAYISAPPNISDLMFCNNNIITSKCNNIPISIHIDNNSIIGRINSDITCLSLKSKEFINVIVESICEYSKQLCFKTSKLNANKLAVKQIQLESDSGNNAKAGTLIYDEKTDSVKFYNGHKWRTFKWEEEENQE